MNSGQFAASGSGDVSVARAALRHAGPDASAVMAALEAAIYRQEWHLIEPLLVEFWAAYDAHQPLLRKAGYQLRRIRKGRVESVGMASVGYCPDSRRYVFIGSGVLSGQYCAVKARVAKEIIIGLLA